MIKQMTAKLIQLFLSFFLMDLALAANPPAGFSQGRVLAERACNELAFADRKAECVRVVGGQAAFDPRATELCRGLKYSDKIIKCLRTIANREYREVHLETCKSQAFSDRIISCLGTAGEPTPGAKAPAPEITENTQGVGLEEIRLDLQRAIQQLSSGNSKNARAVLRDVLEKIDQLEKRDKKTN